MLTFGIEEEFLLVDPATRDVVPLPSPEFLRACGDAFGDRLAGEMFQCQLELVSPVLHDLQQARRWLRESRGMLAETAARFDLAPLCAGAHPFADWRAQIGNPSPHYQQLFTDYRDIAASSLLNGLHVHVGVPAGIDRIGVMNRVLPWLPLLLALSASSPFWEGRRTGMASYRRTLCGLWPRMNLPEPLANEDDYRARTAALVAAKALRRKADIWWFIRPSTRFPTLELRITDACPLLEDTLCIAAMFRALVEWTSEDDRKPDQLAQRWVVEENYWRARRDGIQAVFIDRDGVERDVASWLRELEGVIGSEAPTHAQAVLSRGNSSQRQLIAHEEALQAGLSERQALEKVVELVLSETAETSTPLTSGE